MTTTAPTRRTWIALAAAGSAALLAGAFGFQYLGGLLPCAMCIWQRWPHAVAIALGAIGMAIPSAIVAGLGALSMLGNAGIALYHTGVERDWWEGPTSCSGSGIADMNVADLLNPDMGTGIVLCDEVAWEMLGLSMASWNGLGSLALAGLWIVAATRPRRA
ncbi:disulfide bond formation protein B [Roseibacterium sp. SDUM158017]|uniref:disulfide bond formation protein B n=1 Tax=Roseicyclus salinarum TaxID=3036773 RepID=UPI0024151CF3|nr:disulfide bond formation protein B [Roseibacterium sp. SDUM158017]MDG4650350.1 disulfide bond formation protein B [Roseibacterium sp. SDUM158017]